MGKQRSSWPEVASHERHCSHRDFFDGNPTVHLALCRADQDLAILAGPERGSTWHTSVLGADGFGRSMLVDYGFPLPIVVEPLEAFASDDIPLLVVDPWRGGYLDPRTAQSSVDPEMRSHIRIA